MSVKLQLEKERCRCGELGPCCEMSPFGVGGVMRLKVAGEGITDYLLLDFQGVHVVSALDCVFLWVSLGVDEHVVFVP